MTTSSTGGGVPSPSAVSRAMTFCAARLFVPSRAFLALARSPWVATCLILRQEVSHAWTCGRSGRGTCPRLRVLRPRAPQPPGPRSLAAVARMRPGVVHCGGGTVGAVAAVVGPASLLRYNIICLFSEFLLTSSFYQILRILDRPRIREDRPAGARRATLVGHTYYVYILSGT